MFDAYNDGDKFRFNVDAVSGTLHKSTRKSKFCVRTINDKPYIFDTEKPRLTQFSDEIVVLQTMLCGENNILVEYMIKDDYDEMFDRPKPDIDVKDMYGYIKSEIDRKLHSDEKLEQVIEKNKADGYDEFWYDRRYMYEKAVKAIVGEVCKYLESKDIGTFDFNNFSI